MLGALKEAVQKEREGGVGKAMRFLFGFFDLYFLFIRQEYYLRKKGRKNGTAQKVDSGGTVS